MSQEFLEAIPLLVIVLSGGVALNVGFQLFGRKLITDHLKGKSLEIRVPDQSLSVDSRSLFKNPICPGRECGRLDV